MKIFITGHKGRFAREFIKRYGGKYDIIGYDLVDGDDLLDFNKLRTRMEGCDQIIHFAGIPGPVGGKSFDDFFKSNIMGSYNVVKAAAENKIKRLVQISSTTVYGIEKGIPFKYPINEGQLFLSQYVKADQLHCREEDLSYHFSKVIIEQIMAWYGLNKKIEVVALRFGPLDLVFCGTSASINNACQAVDLALNYSGQFWYEPFSIVDDVPHIDTSKAKKILGYKPEKPNYTKDQINSTFDQRNY